MSGRILVAGIGNIFLGDDAFGVEVVHRLIGRALPPHVRVVDFGIRGLDLAYALMDDYDAIILVDAVPRGEAPGTLYTIEPDLDAVDSDGEGDALVEAHSMNPMRVLAMSKVMGACPKRLFVVGCEPEPVVPGDEERMGLSAAVANSVEGAVAMIEALILKLEGEQNERIPEGSVDHSRGGNGGRVAARH